MAPLRVAWRLIREPDGDVVHVVSPRDASHYAFPRAVWDETEVPTYLGLIGCAPSEQVDDLPAIVCERDTIPPYPPTSFPVRVTGKLCFNGLRHAARVVGLRRLLTFLQTRPPTSRGTVDDVLRRVKAWEGRRHTHHCLSRAIARWWLLDGNGHRPALILGVATPAARMHAWVTLEGIHIGEDPDEVAAYQPAVSYEWAAAQRDT